MRWEGVRVTGADEHVRRRAGADRFVTVIADPAPVRERRGLSRTRGIVTGHFKIGSQNVAGGRARLLEGGYRSGGDRRDRLGAQERGRRRTTGQQGVFNCLCIPLI